MTIRRSEQASEPEINRMPEAAHPSDVPKSTSCVQRASTRRMHSTQKWSFWRRNRDKIGLWVVSGLASTTFTVLGKYLLHCLGTD
jgi:hypothetical protein